MYITLIRTTLLYFFVIIIMRVMGKRQIGELQPTELVITILLSEIISIPMQNNDIPLISTVVPVLVLVGFEIIISIISLKSVKIRNLMQGNAITIIKDGKLDLKRIKELRFSIDDVLEALRQKDVFDISKVQYAVVETNGTMSVLLKPQYEPATRKDLKVSVNKTGMPCAVVVDGHIMEENFECCDMTNDKLKKAMKKEKVEIKNTLLMTIDKEGNTTVIRKDTK